MWSLYLTHTDYRGHVIRGHVILPLYLNHTDYTSQVIWGHVIRGHVIRGHVILPLYLTHTDYRSHVIRGHVTRGHVILPLYLTHTDYRSHVIRGSSRMEGYVLNKAIQLFLLIILLSYPIPSGFTPAQSTTSQPPYTLNLHLLLPDSPSHPISCKLKPFSLLPLHFSTPPCLYSCPARSTPAILIPAGSTLTLHDEALLTPPGSPISSQKRQTQTGISCWTVSSTDTLK